mmetsp:Transcript_174640/g.560007  ORF Transcript_174640/g.560007 Transcript_174640/m.560007 type:complete len:249 (-) Transcript_174640:2149-2895(-)
MTLHDEVAHVLHDARQTLPVQLAARQQHDVRVRLQRALDCDVGPRVAGHADEDPESAGRLGHAPQLPDVRAQGVADRVVADGLLHEGEVAVDAHRHADDRALEALSSARLGDECRIHLSLHIADDYQSIQALLPNRARDGRQMVLEDQATTLAGVAQQVLTAQVPILINDLSIDFHDEALDEALVASLEADQLRGRLLRRQMVEDAGDDAVEAGRLVAREDDADPPRAPQRRRLHSPERGVRRGLLYR